MKTKLNEQTRMKEETSLLSLLLLTFLVFSVLFGLATAQAADTEPSPVAGVAPIPAAYQLTTPAVEEAVAHALVEHGAGQRVKATVVSGKRILFESATPVEVELKSFQFDKSANRWNANMLVTDGTNVLTAMPLAGRFTEVRQLPVLARAVKSGDIITEADVELQDVSLTSIRPDMVTDKAQLIGLSPHGLISGKRPVRESELTAPAVVKRGALVQMHYESNGIQIIASGQTLTQGAKGDVIEVRNTNSKQIVRAAVQDASNVNIITGTQQASAGDVHANY